MKQGLGIGGKITLTMVISIGILLAILCTILVLRINNELEPLNLDYCDEVVYARASEVEQWVESYVMILQYVAERDEFRNGEWDAIKKYIASDQVQKDENFTTFFYADSSGSTYASNMVASVQGNDSISERDYFQKIIYGGEEYFVSNAIASKADASAVIVVAHAVYDWNEKKSGIVGGTISLDKLTSLVNTITLGTNGYAYICDGTSLFIAHPKKEYQNTVKIVDLVDSGMKGADLIAEEVMNGESGTRWLKNGVGVASLFVYHPIPLTPNWSLGVVVPEAQIQETSQSLMVITIIISAIILAITSVVVIFFSRSVSKPIIRIAVAADLISRGDLDVDGEAARKAGDPDRRDEIGQASRAFFGLIEYITAKVDLAQEIASGNLDVEVSVSSEKDRLGLALEAMVGSLNEVLGNVQGAVSQVNAGADQVSQASQDLSRGATEQASSLEEISSSINEINSQSQQNAENATEANALARQAANSAESGNEEMKNLTTAMATINTSSDEIKKVVKVIDDIAFQINLLALNANVEAARAGKYGKGFAVVAEEVRNLAVKSADAVKETTVMVEESIRNIDTGNKSVEATAKQLEEISSGITKVATFLDEIALASKEQAQGINQITDGLDQIEQVTQSNTASAEESASASEELAGQAQELQRLISRFRLKRESRALLGHSIAEMETHRQAGTDTGISRYPQRRAKSLHREETGIRPVNPGEDILLEDKDFDRF